MPLIDLYADCKTAMINSSSLAMNWIIYHIQASTPKSKAIPQERINHAVNNIQIESQKQNEQPNLDTYLSALFS